MARKKVPERSRGDLTPEEKGPRAESRGPYARGKKVDEGNRTDLTQEEKAVSCSLKKQYNQ